MSATVFATRPAPRSPDELSDDVGTLSRRAGRLEDRISGGEKKKKSKFEQTRERVESVSGYTSIKKATESDARSLANMLSDVEGFTKLIDDRKVTFEQLSVFAAANSPFHVLCSGTNPDPGESGLVMRPTLSFLRCVARYANEKSGRDATGARASRRVEGLAGTFLYSLTDGPLDARPIACQLLNYLLKRVEKTFTRANRVPATVLLRTLKPDFNGRWPSYRTCRAILHDGFRDDLSHQWVARTMAGLIPGGSVIRHLFDGDLLKGCILAPDICRMESDSEYGGGLFFFSGEVGNRRAGVQPFVYRAVSSSVVMYGKSWGVTHSTGSDLSKLRMDLANYVHEQIPLVTVAMDKMIRSRDITFDESDPLVIERLLLAVRSSFDGLTIQDLRLWKCGILNEKNLVPLALSVFTLQNGLTRVSQAVEDPMRQVQLEQYAGKLVDLDWEKLTKRAQTIHDDQVLHIFQHVRG